MSWKALEKRRAELRAQDPNSFAVKVYDIFFRQPQQIGPNAGSLKPLDLGDPAHRSIFWGTVASEVGELKRKGGFRALAEIENSNDEAWEILLKK